MKTKILNFFIGFLIIFPIITLGDDSTNTKIVDLRFDQPNYPSSVLHLNKRTSERLNIEEFVGQFLLLRGGVKIPSEKPNRSRTYFITNPDISSCSGENIEDTNFIVGDNNKKLSEKISLFRQCIRFLVEDPNKGAIEFAPGDQDCKIQKLNDYTALLAGGDCFIKGKQGQNLSVTVKTNPNCQDKEFLKSLAINPMEMEGVLETYIYPKGEIGSIFIPTKNLWSQNININLNAGDELLGQVMMDGEARGEVFFRPDSFLMPDVVVSNLRVFNQEKLGRIELSLLISNFGGKNFCHTGLCSNYLNFDIPFAPLFILYEFDPKRNRKFEIGISDALGDRLPGQWNGETESKVYFYNVAFEKGKKYSIELIFSDPTQDYIRLKKFYSSPLNMEGMRLGSFKPGLDGMRSFEGFSGISDGIGELPGLNAEGNFVRGIPKDPDLELPRITTTFNDPTFPPNYLKICNKDLSICRSITSKEHTKFSMDFEVVDISGPKIILGDKIKIQRTSDLLPNSTSFLNLTKRPKIKCK